MGGSDSLSIRPTESQGSVEQYCEFESHWLRPPTSFRCAWAKACETAGLPVIKPYETLRHSTATEWMRRGASERGVQELLGRRTQHATPRYARLADERLESIVGRRRNED